MWWRLHDGNPSVAALALLLIYWQIPDFTCLVGENVCKEEQTYNITKRIRYEVPVTVRKYEWCLAIPPRCTRYITEIQEDTKMETEKRVEELEVCCPGFQQRGQRCVPRCPAGRRGEKCDEECPPTRWGASCSKACSCPERSSCDTRNGKCICHEGWGGTRCDKEIDLSTPSRPITFDQNSLDWTTEITYPTDMFESTTILVPSFKVVENETDTSATAKDSKSDLNKNTKLDKSQNENEEATNKSIPQELTTHLNILKNINVTPMPNITTQIVNPPVINNIAINNREMQETTIKPYNNTSITNNNNIKSKNITNIPTNNNNFEYKSKTEKSTKNSMSSNTNHTENNYRAINIITITTTKPTLNNFFTKTIVTPTTAKTDISTKKVIKSYPVTTQTPITRIKIKNITEYNVNSNSTKFKAITFISPIFKFSLINNKTVVLTSPNPEDSQIKDTTITYINPSTKLIEKLVESNNKYTSPMKKVTTPSSISTTNYVIKKTESLTKQLENLKENAQKIQRKSENLSKDPHLSTTNSVEADEVHILTEPEHITSVAGDRGFDSRSDNLISVLSLVCGGVLALIVVAVIIVMVERRRKSRSEDIHGSVETIEENEGGEEVSTYMRSILNSPLPDPPCEDNIERSKVKSFHGDFLRPVVIHAISPIMVENFRDILESHYDHLPPRNLRPQSWFQKETPLSMVQMSNFDKDHKHTNSFNNNLPVTETSIDTLKLESSITDVEDIEPVYDEIPFWRPPSQYAIEVVNLNGEAVTEL